MNEKNNTTVIGVIIGLLILIVIGIGIGIRNQKLLLTQLSIK